MDFHRFYQTWYEQLHDLVNHLNKAPKPPTTDDDDHQLTQLVNKVMFHFSEYYRVKSLAANKDVLSIFSAKWSTTLERSLHWIAGWRPTTAFHLIYTESSILFESRILDILHGLRTGDLGDLSPVQFTRVSELQCETVHQENSITDQLSEWQAYNFLFQFQLCFVTLLPNYQSFCRLSLTCRTIWLSFKDRSLSFISTSIIYLFLMNPLDKMFISSKTINLFVGEIFVARFLITILISMLVNNCCSWLKYSIFLCSSYSRMRQVS